MKKLSTREKYIAIGAAAVFGLLALDQVILTPLFTRLNDADRHVTQSREELQRADQLFQNSLRARRRWKEIAANTVMTDSPSAESQLLNHVRDWAGAAGVSLSALKPGRGEKEKGFDKITVQATGTGSMSQMAKLLYSLHTATVPVRIDDMQLTSRKEGTDDLSLQIAISTIYATPVDVASSGSKGGTIR